MSVTIAPNHRIAIVGKSGSGKSHMAVILACVLVPADEDTWQVWWLDTKGDIRDQDMLRRWGFTQDMPGPGARKLILLHDDTDDVVSLRVNWWCQQALKRHNVLVVIDEYSHACMSSRRAGPGIAGIFKRGRGLNVGIIGATQEPVDIPRVLFSQAYHVLLFDLFYERDIEYIQKMCRVYERPPDTDPYGFYWGAVESRARWQYYRHVRAWHDTLTDDAKAG